MRSWEQQVQDEIPRYSVTLGSLMGLRDTNPKLKLIIDSVLTSAANASLNAGYSGSWSDGGASNSVNALKGFLEGYSFALGSNAGDYQEILDNHAREQDPEYQKFLELSEKFKKK